MSVRELETKISTIKNSDEYVRLLIRNRGPLEERRLRELNIRINAFEVQLNALTAATTAAIASSAPFKPSLITRGLPQSKTNAKSAVAVAAVHQQAAATKAHTGLRPAPIRPGRKVGGFMNPAVGEAEPTYKPVEPVNTGKFGMKPRGATVGQLKASVDGKFGRTEIPLPAPPTAIHDGFVDGDDDFGMDV